MKVERLEIVDDIMAEVLISKSPLERLQIAFGLWRSARHQLASHLRNQHPDWEEDKLNSEIARRMSHGTA